MFHSLCTSSRLQLGYSSRGHPGANTSVIKYTRARAGLIIQLLYNYTQRERERLLGLELNVTVAFGSVRMLY